MPAYRICFSCTFIIPRCGDALKMIFLSPVMQHIMCGIPMEDLQGTRAIYQPGTPRKVYIVSLCYNFNILISYTERTKDISERSTTDTSW